MRDRTATINRAKTLGLELLKRQAALRLKHIARQLDGLGACARGLVAADPLLARRFAVLTSIPGIGEATAAALIVDMPELGRMGAKQAASLAGLAPVSPGPGAARARSAAAAPTCVRRSTCRPWSPPASTRASKQGSPP